MICILICITDAFKELLVSPASIFKIIWVGVGIKYLIGTKNVCNSENTSTTIRKKGRVLLNLWALFYRKDTTVVCKEQETRVVEKLLLHMRKCTIPASYEAMNRCPFFLSLLPSLPSCHVFSVHINIVVYSLNTLRKGSTVSIFQRHWRVNAKPWVTEQVCDWAG